MPRLFVAVWPPDDVLDAIAGLDRPSVTGLRWTTRDQWHVTLRFLGQVDDVEPVVEALAGVAGRGPVDALLGPRTGRFDHRILHVPVDGLSGVAGDVIAATARIGRPPEDRAFAGHITLARTGRGARVDLRPLAGVAVAGTWTVTDVCLVESHLSSAGARYEVVGRVALAPGAV